MYDQEKLRAARLSILSGRLPEMEVKGDHEGEQLTHVLASIFILEEMEKNGGDYVVALRKFLNRVRSSVDLR